MVPDPSTRSFDSSAHGDAGEGSGPRRILVVDDSADMRQVVHEILAEAGYDVVEAPSGARALEVMSEWLPDLVITDLLMPGMSGFSLRSAMLRRPDLAGVPVIVLSGFWQRPGETLDAVEALPKPLSVERLLASVRRAMDGTDGTPRPKQPPQ